MDRKEIIAGLRDLIKDRESFFGEDDEWDAQFRYDAHILLAAIDLIEKESLT